MRSPLAAVLVFAAIGLQRTAGGEPSTSQRLVTVDVIAADARGRTVDDLKPGDFDWPKIFARGVRWFHCGGIFAALSAAAVKCNCAHTRCPSIASVMNTAAVIIVHATSSLLLPWV